MNPDKYIHIYTHKHVYVYTATHIYIHIYIFLEENILESWPIEFRNISNDCVRWLCVLQRKTEIDRWREREREMERELP